MVMVLAPMNVQLAPSGWMASWNAGVAPHWIPVSYEFSRLKMMATPWVVLGQVPA
jgi:hypothetical protein